MAGTPLQQGGGGLENRKKNCKRNDPEHFGLIRRVLRGAGGVGTIFMTAVPPLPATSWHTCTQSRPDMA